MAVVFKESEIAEEFKKNFRRSSIFVMRTDTVYGIQGVATDSALRKRISDLKGREGDQLITLVSRIDEIKDLAELSIENRRTLEKYWPGAITFILPTKEGGTAAFRMPNQPVLRKILEITGPLVSTSCNRHGEKVVTSVEEATTIFGEGIDFYVDGGAVEKTVPSTLVDLTTNPPKILRQGAVKF